MLFEKYKIFHRSIFLTQWGDAGPLCCYSPWGLFTSTHISIISSYEKKGVDENRKKKIASARL